MYDGIPDSLSTQILINDIQKKTYDVKNILEGALHEINADDARFRLKSWDDKSVVHVADWIIGGALPWIQPELAERVYDDPKSPSKIDCKVGLEGLIARIEEEKDKLERLRLIRKVKANEFKYSFSWDEITKNNDRALKEFLKLSYSIDWVETAQLEKKDNIIKIFTENNNSLSLKLNDEKTKINIEIDDGRTDEFIVKTENSKLKIYKFNPRNRCVYVYDEPEFRDFIGGLKEKKTGLEEKKEIWEKYYDDIKNIQTDNKDNFFREAFKEPPWRKEDDYEEKEKQWKDLQDYFNLIEQEKNKNAVTCFLEAVKKTVDHYTTLYDNHSEYISSIEVPKWEIAVPVKAFGKFIGVLNFHKKTELDAEGKPDEKSKFNEKEENLANAYAARLAVTYLQWRDTLFEKFQNVAQTLTAKSNFEVIASMITEGIRTGLQHGLKDFEVFPLLYISKKPLHYRTLNENENLNKEIFEDNWKKSYKQRLEPQDKESDDYKLWKTGNDLGSIPIRYKGFGWKILKKLGDVTKNKKSPEAKEIFDVCPYVDNPNSKCGSRSALYSHILTTGCIPLIYDNKVYGLLYLHCKKRHFFTDVELNALYTFSVQAAIAIHNAKFTGESYETLFGNKLLELLEEVCKK